MAQNQQNFESNNRLVESIEDFNTNETIIVSNKQHFDEKMDKIDDKLLDELQNDFNSNNNKIEEEKSIKLNSFEQNLIQSNQNVINEENFENNFENNKPMSGRDSEPKEVVTVEGVDQGMGSEDNLYDANLEREVEGHEKQIHKTLSNGEELREQNHFRKKEIEDKCLELSSKWNQLKQSVLERKKLLEISLRIQQLLSEANEVESWMNEKFNILNSNDYGKDDNTDIKLLTKQKVIELEVDNIFTDNH